MDYYSEKRKAEYTKKFKAYIDSVCAGVDDNYPIARFSADFYKYYQANPMPGVETKFIKVNGLYIASLEYKADHPIKAMEMMRKMIEKYKPDYPEISEDGAMFAEEDNRITLVFRVFKFNRPKGNK